MSNFLLILLAYVMVFSAAEDLRIKGTRDAKINDFPSIASISSNGEFISHGIILSKKVILAPSL